MLVLGFRRDDARDLASYLLRQGKNEEITIRSISHFHWTKLTPEDVLKVFDFMHTQASLKGVVKSIYHVVLSLRETEHLTSEQLTIAVDVLARNFGLENHHCVVIEHKKKGNPHFHVVFNLINPSTGKLVSHKWAYEQRHQAAAELAEKFGFVYDAPKRVWPIRRWEYNRGKKSGIDPLQMRKEITEIYIKSKTGKEFIQHLGAAGYILSKGRHDNYILIDRAKDIHGLIRRLEDVKLSDFEKKFPDLKNLNLTPLEAIPGIKKRVRLRDLKRNVIAFRRIAKILLRPARNGAPVPAAPAHEMPSLVKRSPLAIMLTRSRARYNDVLNDYEPIYFSQPKHGRHEENLPDSEKPQLSHAAMSSEELLAWAFANKRADILAEFGVYLPNLTEDP